MVSVLVAGCGDDEEGTTAASTSAGSGSGSAGTTTAGTSSAGSGGTSSAGTTSAGTTSAGTTSAGSGGTGVAFDCMNGPDFCDDASICYCYDRTGDGTMVECFCAPTCQTDDNCLDPDAPNCGCGMGDTPGCVSDLICFGG